MDRTAADAAFSQAVEHQQAGRLAQARALYEQIMQAHPTYPHVPHLLGVIVSQQGDWFLARRLIESALLLHASELGFTHPDGGAPLELRSAVPF